MKKSCSDWMSGSHFSMQTSKFLLINVTAVTMGQGHKKIISYISLYPYILCPKYVRFGTNGLEVRGKRLCGGVRSSVHGRNKLKT